MQNLSSLIGRIDGISGVLNMCVQLGRGNRTWTCDLTSPFCQKVEAIRRVTN